MKHPLLIIACLAASAAQAKVTLPGTFSDNMVLQQQRTFTVSGKARPGATVRINLGWQKSQVTATADAAGRWSTSITTPKGSKKAYTLTFDDGEATTFSNVLVGEVWFGSGQSNMEMPVEGWGHVMNWEQEKAAAHHPMIRLFQAKQVTALTPQDEVPLGYTNGWVECSPETVGEFSSLAYFYARELTQKLGVPVGVINSSWGGTPAEAWTSHEALKGVTGFEERLGRIEATGFKADAIQKMYDAEQAAHRQHIIDADCGIGASLATPVFAAPDFDDSRWATMQLPVYWESVGLDGFDGVVWFRKTIDVPADKAGQDFVLDFGPIDDEDITYWNGEKVAQGWGYNNPRHYVVPGRYVKAGRNVICVRVTDNGGEGGIAGTPDQMTLAGDWKYAIGFDGHTLPPSPTAPGSNWWPSALYNAMVHPFLHFPIRGVIWYQGCANEDRPEQYEPLFQTLIHDWQRAFNQPTLPFHFVQLANFHAPSDLQPDSKWARLRESQRMAKKIDGVEMMVNIDLGEAYDIHPKNKQEVARRLAALSLARTYGQKVAGEAPEFDHYTVCGNVLTVHFRQSDIAEPFLADADVQGFTLQAPDGTWHKAQARTEGQTVVITSPEVAMPVAVRYGWADNPTCSLRTKSGFRVSPFRSTPYEATK